MQSFDEKQNNPHARGRAASAEEYNVFIDSQKPVGQTGIKYTTLKQDPLKRLRGTLRGALRVRQEVSCDEAQAELPSCTFCMRSRRSWEGVVGKHQKKTSTSDNRWFERSRDYLQRVLTKSEAHASSIMPKDSRRSSTSWWSETWRRCPTRLAPRISRPLGGMGATDSCVRKQMSPALRWLPESRRYVRYIAAMSLQA